MSSTSTRSKAGGNTPFQIPSQIPLLPPPPPPDWVKGASKLPSDDEAMSSMLMAWYMSGYHTGYYQAMRDVQQHEF